MIWRLQVLILSPKGSEEVFSTRVNPEMPIPSKSTDIHGITDKDVEQSPRFRDIAKKVTSFIEGCDLAGFNALKFDVPILAEELLRVDVDFNL